MEQDAGRLADALALARAVGINPSPLVPPSRRRRKGKPGRLGRLFQVGRSAPPQKFEEPGDLARRAVAAIDVGRTQEGPALAMAALTLQLPASGRILHGLAGALIDQARVYRGLPPLCGTPRADDREGWPGRWRDSPHRPLPRRQPAR